MILPLFYARSSNSSTYTTKVAAKKKVHTRRPHSSVWIWMVDAIYVDDGSDMRRMIDMDENRIERFHE